MGRTKLSIEPVCWHTHFTWGERLVLQYHYGGTNNYQKIQSPTLLGRLLGKSERSIRRELQRGMVLHERGDVPFEQWDYNAEYAQNDAERKSLGKGSDLKPGKDWTFVAHVSQLVKVRHFFTANSIFLDTLTEGHFPWSSMTTKSGDKADWKYFEFFIYAPFSINLMIPLGFIRPYIGLGPAFYFHFPSTNQDSNLTNYFATHYGSASVTGRIGQRLTARVGFDILLSDTVGIGVGYVVREDTPATIFNDIGDLDSYKRNGYIFALGRVYLK